jgi:DNA repair protein RecO (recombination protein O)
MAPGDNHFICDTLKFPRVPACVSEALVLRTYPLKEADLVVSFLTRDQGKLRGVAKRARRPKSSFGAGLERLSHVRMAYFQRETRELVSLDSCELIQSQFSLVSDYWTSVALDYFAEVSDQLLPSAEPGEKFFRLLLAVLESLQAPAAGKAWRAVTYFSLWALRLSGWLPELHVCLGCGSLLDDPENPQRAFFTRGQAGLMCSHCRRSAGAASSWELSAASRALAAEMLRKPVAGLPPMEWSQATVGDLRRFLVQQIEAHAERKLYTAQLFAEIAAP